MSVVVMAEAILVLTSIAGLICCWREFFANGPFTRDRRMLALFMSSSIGVLPLAFYLLEPSSRASSLIEVRVYSIGILLLMSLVGCPSAIALYFSQPKRSFFFLFCASTVGATSGTILAGLASMGVSA
jgi:ABC-type Mn2+/Zn2+ transport system permease subunit